MSLLREELKNIVERLKPLGLSAFKASFEDEGISDSDLIKLLLVSAKANIPTFVKVGGCEAKRDIDFCLIHGVEGIVAPMVESSFAVSKFVNSVAEKCVNHAIIKPKIYVNIETVDACKNIKEILQVHHENLTGVVVGRSDLSMSLGLSKSNVEDFQVMNYVREVFETAKTYGLETSMGGRISRNSITNIENLYSRSLLDKFQTRTLVFSLNPNSDISFVISDALKYEQALLNYRMFDPGRVSRGFQARIESIEKRK